MNETIKPRIHLRKPITGLKVTYYGPEPLRAEEAAEKENKAYERGRNDAEEVCRRQILQARKEMEQLQNEVLANIQARYAELADQFNEKLPDLVLAIVGKIWEGVKIDRPAILAAIDAALAQVGNNNDNLVLKLSTADAGLLQGTETFKNRFPDIIVEADPELQSGDVMIKSRFGLIDSRISTKIRRVEEEIKETRQ
jgi:flagellar biosynthesis/type III secretory pathway protein FliH